MPPDRADDQAPIIVSALFAGEDQAWLDGLRRVHFPPARNQLAAHLTLFHHLPPSLAEELRDRLAILTRGEDGLPAEAAGLMNLGGGTAIRIVCPPLEAIRAELAEAFRGMLVPQDAAGWRPHVTIQNKVTAAEAAALRATLEPGFAKPRPLRVAALAAWWYRGGPWEAMARHPFRR